MMAQQLHQFNSAAKFSNASPGRDASSVWGWCCHPNATVLAQCNTFILHRIVNDSDQNLVARLVPDNVGGLLRELPSLPSRQAILMGWAAPIPVLVDVEELPECQRPQSADPDFWNVWTLAEKRDVDWAAIVKDLAGQSEVVTDDGDSLPSEEASDL